MPRFLLDTSAVARAGRPDVREQLKMLLEADGELVLSAPVVLELLREPVGPRVAPRRAELVSAYAVLVPDVETFGLAYSTMERLAAHDPTAHRLPAADLVTAALAAQYECVLVHVDRDFELLAEHGGLRFEALRLRLDAPATVGEDLVHTQRYCDVSFTKHSICCRSATRSPSSSTPSLLRARVAIGRERLRTR